MHAGAGEKCKKKDITVAESRKFQQDELNQDQSVGKERKNRTRLANEHIARPACGVRRG
jgi:hypothetical protein